MISVIIPLYNKQATIFTTIQSVLGQTFKNFELLIINDGSTDNSMTIVSSIKDPRIRIIDKENEGVSATRNRGAKESKFDLLFFLDADDYIYPNCLETLSKIYASYQKADVWSANYEMRNSKQARVVLSKSLFGYIKTPHKLIYYRDWHFRMGSFLITKNSFLTIGGYLNSMTVGEDFYFMDKFCEKYNAVYIPDIVMAYVQDSRGLSRGGIPYQKVIEYHLNFKNKNNWQKLIYSELITKRIIKAILRGDYNESKALIFKHRFWCFYGLYSIIISSFNLILKSIKFRS